MYYYDLIREGKINLDTTIVATSEDFKEGGKFIQNTNQEVVCLLKNYFMNLLLIVIIQH